MAALRLVIILLAGTLLLSACGAPEGTLRATTPTLPPTPLPLATGPSPDPFFASDGGGEPRTSGYWLVWNGCTPDNRAEVAAANGGQQAGWIIMDDLLLDPGILLGQLQVESCQQGANLLERLDTSGGEHKGDPAYQLAQGLLAAQLNLAAGGEFCPAAGEAVQAG